MSTISPTRPPAAALVLAVLLGLAIGIAAALLAHPVMRGSAADRTASPTTVGGDFWTVVVASIPSGQPDGRARADARAGELRALGVEAGVLDSSAYSSLNGGYLVVFSGRFPTRERAEEHLRALRHELLPQGPNPYVREVRD